MDSDQTPGLTPEEKQELNELHRRPPADARQTIQRIRERLDGVRMDGLTDEESLAISSARVRLASEEAKLGP